MGDTNNTAKELPTKQYFDHFIKQIYKKKKVSVNFKPFLGFFYAFATCLFYSLASVILKKMTYISPGELTLVRSTGIFTGALSLAIYNVDDILGEKKWRYLLLVRGICGSVGLFCMSLAYSYLPLAEATIIISTFPVATAVIAHIFLKEECSVFQSVALVSAVFGVMISVPLPELLVNSGDVTLNSAYMLGLAAAFGTVLAQSTVFVIVRKIKHIHFSVIMLYYGAAGMITNIPMTFASAKFVTPRCGWDQTLLILIGVFGCLGNLTNTVTVQVEGAGLASALRTMQIVMAMVFQVIFFGENPDIYNICGGCIVMLSLILLGVRKWVATLPNESKLRSKLKCILY